jgi:hypothetical protein
LSKLADVATGNALISGGVSTAPSWGKIGLTTHVSGVLPVANGGTNASTSSITSFNNITGYTASGATGTTSTNLVFSTSPTITTPSVTGDLTMSTGNVVIGTSGKGIDFSATSGSGTSELLSDYEEGTWTPDVIGNTTAGTTTYTTRLGWYTKVGRQVTAVAVLDITNMTGTGLIKIQGLPYTISALSGFVATGSILSSNLDWPSGSAISMYLPGNNAYAFIFAVGDNIGWAGVSVDATWEAIITMTYFA